MHIQLNKKNTAKLLPLAGKMDTTVNQLVNEIIARVEFIEEVKTISFDATKEIGTNQETQQPIRVGKRIKWIERGLKP